MLCLERDHKILEFVRLVELVTTAFSKNCSECLMKTLTFICHLNVIANESLCQRRYMRGENWGEHINAAPASFVQWLHEKKKNKACNQSATDTANINTNTDTAASSAHQ